jgi:hypothetical protein
LIENYIKPEKKTLSKFEKIEKRLSFRNEKINSKKDDNIILDNDEYEKNEKIEDIFEKNDLIFFGGFFIGLFFSYFLYGWLGFFLTFVGGSVLIFYQYFMN